MSKKRIFSDPKVREEFFDRFDELQGEVLGESGLEAMRGAGAAAYSRSDAERTARVLEEDTGEPIDRALEAIILRFGRPAYFVQDDTFDTSAAPSSSAEVDAVVNQARSVIDAAIPSVGRINLRDHRMPWVGTGWLVAEDVLVTNRHVASEFAQRDGDAYVFIETAGRKAKAYLDTVREYQSSREIVFRLKEVLWIAPPSGSHDVAFLSIDRQSEDGHSQPPMIELMDQETYDDLPVETWTAVIGYPAFSIYNNAQDQQRIFEGVFDIKRLQPGKIVAKGADGIVNHDATTLGGNSGSVVLHLDSGKAVALHFGGIEGDTNSAVAAPVVADLLRRHASE